VGSLVAVRGLLGRWRPRGLTHVALGRLLEQEVAPGAVDAPILRGDHALPDVLQGAPGGEAAVDGGWPTKC
jgi:hypothetical protein